MIVSLATMIARLEGMLGTADLSDWEQRFVRNVANTMRARGTVNLSEEQVDKVDELHERHFA